MGAIFGGIGVLIQAFIREWGLRNAHKREVEMIDKDMELMKLEMEVAPKSTGSTSGIGSGTPTFDKVMPQVELPKWSLTLRSLMRPFLAFITMGGLLFGFTVLLLSGGDLAVYQQTMFVEFGSLLEFLLLMVGTFYFGSRVIKR